MDELGDGTGVFFFFVPDFLLSFPLLSLFFSSPLFSLSFPSPPPLPLAPAARFFLKGRQLAPGSSAKVSS
jgi:hypothetical protein